MYVFLGNREALDKHLYVTPFRLHFFVFEKHRCLGVSLPHLRMLLVFVVGASAGLCEKLGGQRAEVALKGQAKALNVHRERKVAKGRLGEPWFRCDFTSLMLYGAMAKVDLPNALLHAFCVSLLFQRFQVYEKFQVSPAGLFRIHWEPQGR